MKGKHAVRFEFFTWVREDDNVRVFHAETRFRLFTCSRGKGVETWTHPGLIVQG